MLGGITRLAVELAIATGADMAWLIPGLVLIVLVCAVAALIGPGLMARWPVLDYRADLRAYLGAPHSPPGPSPGFQWSVAGPLLAIALLVAIVTAALVPGPGWAAGAILASVLLRTAIAFAVR
jgi:hypothetical protein